MSKNKSEIFSASLKSNSAVLRAPFLRHLHFHYARPKEVQEALIVQIQRTAGEFYGQEKYDEAERYRQAANVLRKISTDDAGLHCLTSSVEASYEWIAEMVEFFQNEGAKHLPKTERS